MEHKNFTMTPVPTQQQSRLLLAQNKLNRETEEQEDDKPKQNKKFLLRTQVVTQLGKTNFLSANSNRKFYNSIYSSYTIVASFT